MAQKQKQHHCPVCKAIAKPRCFLKNHLVHCEAHDVYHSDYSECAQCKANRERTAAKARDPSTAIRVDKNKTLKTAKGKKNRGVESSIDEADQVASSAVRGKLSPRERREGDLQLLERQRKGEDGVEQGGMR